MCIQSSRCFLCSNLCLSLNLALISLNRLSVPSVLIWAPLACGLLGWLYSSLGRSSHAHLLLLTLVTFFLRGDTLTLNSQAELSGILLQVSSYPLVPVSLQLLWDTLQLVIVTLQTYWKADHEKLTCPEGFLPSLSFRYGISRVLLESGKKECH